MIPSVPMASPVVWPGADGAPLSCREKLKVLAENHAELAQTLRDAFEDAILMGVDETAMRGILTGMIQGLESPRRGGSADGEATRAEPSHAQPSNTQPSNAQLSNSGQ